MLDKYPHFIKDVITIIDYDTEIQMGGLDEIINGNMQEMFLKYYKIRKLWCKQRSQFAEKAKAMTPQEYNKNIMICIINWL